MAARSAARLESSSVAPADSSELAAVRWVIWLIFATAAFTCSMPSACSLQTAAISDIRSPALPVRSRIRPREFATSTVILTPPSAFLTDSSIISAVFLAASALSIARLRTSSATTANPLPASPARAASTAALRARRLVWKAMSSIVLMILAVLSADCFI
ncbi:hypothetical protein R80B4_00001 [Fibrobacteres bacterium R8-0-B4]